MPIADMFTEDYILRLVRQATAALATILGLVKAGQFQEAHHTIDQTLESLVGLSASLVRVMDDQSLINLLTSQDKLDSERLVIVADLFKVEGDLLAQNSDSLSRESHVRALNLYLEAVLYDQRLPNAELSFKIETLYRQLANTQLPAETLLRLHDFYTRLLELDDAVLTNNPVTSTEAERHRQEINQHTRPAPSARN